jgi:zinc transporter ZupT
MDSTPNIEVADDKNIITDIAFGVDDALLGKPLASPMRRAFAIIIDAFLVLMLTHVSAVVASIVAGLAIFKFGKKSEQKSWRIARYLLRFIGGFTVFVSVLVILNNTFNDDELSGNAGKDNAEIKINSVDSFANSVKLGALALSLTNKLEQGNCERSCYHPLVEDVLDTLVELKAPEDEIYEFIDDNSNDLPINSEQERLEYVAELYEYYQNALETTKPDQEITTVEASILENQTPEAPTASANKYYQARNEKADSSKANKTEQPVYSLLEFAKGIIADLGLGFGWAALYFTAFPAWWKGQTPGKKLMGIRVIQLDGTYMSAWDSFGRYGGYGAGFATGLLGFFQIYWDSNRQAIQDKISATVVIKGDL